MDINKENNNLEITDSTDIENVTEIETDEVKDTFIEDEKESENLNEDFEEAFDEEDIEDGYEAEADDELSETLPQKKTCAIQKNIIIAMVAFLLTALIVFGSVLVYDLVKGKEETGIVGVWTFADNPDCGEYFMFEEDGTMYYDIGSVRYYGNYTTETVESEGTDTEEAESYEMFSTDFYMLACYYGTEAKMTFSEDYKNLIMEFNYGTTIELARTELPEFIIDPNDITHASADELGITNLVVDDNVVGSWRIGVTGYEDKYETYTFNADGTGEYHGDYVYMDYYGAGYGVEGEFKYTVCDGKILMTQGYYDESAYDLILEYSVDNNKLVLAYGDGNIAAFEKVK